MEDLLQDISAIVGVQGCWICDENGTLIAKDGALAGEEQELGQVGRVLTQTISALSLARRRKVGDIDLVFERGRLLAKNTGEGCLCIQGAPNLNVPLLNLTANLVLRKVKERQKGTAPAPGKLPDAGQALDTFSALLELLLVELGDQGIGRDQLLTIARHRARKLEAAFPFLESIRYAEGKIELGGLPIDTIPAAELGKALAAWIAGLGISLRGMMGEGEAIAKYLGVYLPFYEQNQPSFETLGLADSLKDAFSEDLGPSFVAVDYRLD